MFKRRRRRLIRLCCLAAAARASSPEEEVEVVTLGAMVPPLVSRGRPPGNGAAGRPTKTPTPLEEGESPDQTIARLLNAIIQRESQQHFHDNQEDLAQSTVDDPVGSLPQEALVGSGSSSSRSSSSSNSNNKDDEGRTAAGEEAAISHNVDEKFDESSRVNGSPDSEPSSVRSAAQDVQPSSDIGGGDQEASGAATAIAGAEHVLAGSSSSGTADSPADAEVDGVPSSGSLEGVAQGLGEHSHDASSDAAAAAASAAAAATAGSPAEAEVDAAPSDGSVAGVVKDLGKRSQNASDAPAADAAAGLYAEAASAGEGSTDTSSSEAEIDAAPFAAQAGSAAQPLDGVGDEEKAAASAGESTTVGAEDLEECVDGGEGDATDGTMIDRPPAERGESARSREAAEEGGAVPQPDHDATGTPLPGIDDEHVIVEDEEQEQEEREQEEEEEEEGEEEEEAEEEEEEEGKEEEEEEAAAGKDAGPPPAARPTGDTHDDGRANEAAAASAQPTSNDTSMDGVVITARKEEGAAALLAVESADEDSSVDSGGGEALAGQGGDGAIDAVGDASTAETSSMGSQGEGTDAGGEGQGRAPAVVPATSAGEQDDHRDVDRLEPDARTSAMESSGAFGSSRGAGGPSGAGDDEATGAAVGVDADVAAGANVDGQLETDPGVTEISASEWSGVDARPPRMPSGRWPSPQHEKATTGNAAAVPPDDDVSTSDSSQEVEALLSEEAEEEEEEEARGEDFPRRRPVFRFSESLSAGPDPVDVGLAGQRPPRRWHTADVEDFVVLPPLPQLDSISAEPPGEASDPGGAMVAYSEENGWEAWAAESMVALRKAAVRWAGVAAERGGVLAEEFLEVGKAQVVKSWHETVRPLAGYARRRLEATANFCLGEVGQHLEDAVTAEAL